MKSLILSLLLINSKAYSTDINTINDQIRHLSGKDQKALAALIIRKSKKYNIDPQLVTAIAAKESMLGRTRVNHKSKDYGILQINVYNIKQYGWDQDRIQNDDEYSLDKGLYILHKFKKQYGERESSTWICRYNIGNQSLNRPSIRKICEQYVKDVNSNILKGN